MTVIPKHEATAPIKSKKRTQQAVSVTTAAAAPSVTVRADTSGIEWALTDLAAAVVRYVDRAATDDHNSLAVFTGPEGFGYHPVLLAFQGETTDRLAKAFERIADALAKTAGLELPSLEFPADTDG